MEFKCQKCNKLIQSESKFCPYCGGKIEKAKKKYVTILFPFLILLLLAIIVIVFIENQKNEKHANDSNPIERTYKSDYSVENGNNANQDLYEVFDTYKDTKDPFLNIREGPGTSYSIVYKLKDGERIIVKQWQLGKDAKWVKIYCQKQNVTGYVHSRYIKKVY